MNPPPGTSAAATNADETERVVQQVRADDALRRSLLVASALTLAFTILTAFAALFALTGVLAMAALFIGNGWATFGDPQVQHGLCVVTLIVASSAVPLMLIRAWKRRLAARLATRDEQLTRPRGGILLEINIVIAGLAVWFSIWSPRVWRALSDQPEGLRALATFALPAAPLLVLWVGFVVMRKVRERRGR